MSIRVALLKMNIEGGERHVLKEIDLSIVDRVIVSSHDFRAELGHGEHFRADVLNILDAAGFTCTPGPPRLVGRLDLRGAQARGMSTSSAIAAATDGEIWCGRRRGR